MKSLIDKEYTIPFRLNKTSVDGVIQISNDGTQTKVIKSEDFKTAVNEFRKYQELRRKTGLIGADDVNKFKEIFGDFEE